jgi:prepilin-type N-terminal cleavage/methylation domain-containing protein
MRNADKTRQKGSPRDARGFSLIELLIVVAIILIIAAIAIPNFMRSRMAANETAAVSNMRTIITANVVYSSTYSNGFAPTLLTLTGGPLANCTAASLIDNVLATGQKSGYGYTYTPGIAVLVIPPGCGAAGATSYNLAATPLAVGTTGQRSFCAQENGLIRQDPSGALIAAGACIPPLAAIQ